MARGSSLRIGPANIIRREAGLLVVEFEVEHDGLDLPDEVEVLWQADSIGTAKIDRRESSPKGPHQKAVLVRLAVRFDWDKVWESDPMLVLRWKAERSGVTVHFYLPVMVEATNPA